MTIALSPDGRRIAYVGYINGRQQIYIRDINSFESRPIPGTDGAHTPAFSPDGRSLAFIVDRKLKRVSLDGGTPQVLSELVEGIGLSWSADDTILFNPGLAIGIWRVSANGGRPMEVTRIESKDTQHRFPEMLPNGKGLLFSTTSGVADPNIYVHSFETGRRRFLVNGVAPHYLPTGHLTFVQGLTLFAVPFDLEKLVTTGAPVAVLQNIRTSGDTPLIAFSGAGSMIYLPATGETRDLSIAWVAHDGTEQSVFASGRDIAQPRIAPDGRRVAVTVRAPSDLWSFDLMRETWSRLTYDGQSSFPIWTPDGRRLTFASAKAGPTNIFWKSPDGGESSEERMNVADYAELPLSWSPDGRTLAYVRVDPGTQQDIWTLNLESGGKPQPFLQTRFREGAPQFSPDGRWLAYVSDESGQNEVYVRPFPGPGDKWTVSSEGGNEPIWPRNAQQLFYRKGNTMMAVDVSISPTFSAGKPRQLFEKPYERSNAYWPNYDVTPDGKRFLMVKAAEQLPPSSQVYVVLNWSDELKQRVPAK